ncbi:MAG: RdgB/HAM1 family non-canonical purine NTP pyrophosphatase [Lachnospiraceae bacterium]|nr:RdgB/HAM1 family non-canonical purine NTP pyrophosphatase [Lachnospiraceae bacterium]
MKTIIFATGNKDKLVEIREILAGLDVELKAMSETGFQEDIEENGESFRDNALIKARAVAEYLKDKPEYAEAYVLADDSGLCIDAMGGMPGVQSHRWLGDRTYPQAMQDIIGDMKGLPDEKRTARFTCAIAAVVPGHEDMTVQENVEGIIAREMKGSEGFGYDPFFYVPEFGCTTAEMSREQKNAISHRGKALRAMRDKLVSEGLL